MPGFSDDFWWVLHDQICLICGVQGALRARERNEVLGCLSYIVEGFAGWWRAAEVDFQGNREPVKVFKWARHVRTMVQEPQA
jgi:hypothetical protein